MAMEMTPLSDRDKNYGTMTEEQQPSGDRTPILSDDVSPVKTVYSGGMF